jgi:hypothetical protein
MPPSFTCPERNGNFLPVGIFCSEDYYSCTNNTATKQTCDDTRVFDALAKTCLHVDEISAGCCMLTFNFIHTHTHTNEQLSIVLTAQMDNTISDVHVIFGGV